MPPWVGSGCRQMRVATGSRSSGTASSATRSRPSAVLSVIGSRRAGRTEFARIFSVTPAGYRGPARNPRSTSAVERSRPRRDPSMSQLRTRLLALTCAAAAVLSTAHVTTADASAVSSLDSLRATHPGLDGLLDGGTPTGRAIVELDAAPTAADVAALEALGLTVQPMHRLPLALVQGSVAEIAGVVSHGIGTDVYPDEVLQYDDTASSNAMSSSIGAAKE